MDRVLIRYMVPFICLQNIIVLKCLGINIMIKQLLFHRLQAPKQTAWHEVFYVAEICLRPAIQTLALVQA